MQAPQASFDLLPVELKCHTLASMPVNKQLMARRVCSGWKDIIESSIDWKKLFYLLKDIELSDSRDKSDFFRRVSILRTLTSSKSNAEVCEAHIFLSRIGISTLEKAELALTQVNNKYWMIDLYNKLAMEYIKSDCLSKAKECLSKAQKLLKTTFTTSAQALLALFERYLDKGDFENALSLTDSFCKDSYASKQALSLFIGKAEQLDNSEAALKGLDQFKESCVSTWCAAVQDVAQFLLDRGEKAKAEQLKSKYPKAFDSDDCAAKAMYYTHSGRCQKAMETILEGNLHPWTKKDYLERILKVCKDNHLQSKIEKEISETQKVIDQREMENPSGCTAADLLYY